MSEGFIVFIFISVFSDIGGGGGFKHANPLYHFPHPQNHFSFFFGEGGREGMIWLSAGVTSPPQFVPPPNNMPPKVKPYSLRKKERIQDYLDCVALTPSEKHEQDLLTNVRKIRPNHLYLRGRNSGAVTQPTISKFKLITGTEA